MSSTATETALVELTAAVNRLADLSELILKEQRRVANKLGADIDEVPSAIRIALEAQTKHIEDMVARNLDPKLGLNRLHNILSRARKGLWTEKMADTSPETESHLAIRRLVDFTRDGVREELRLEPEALVEPDVRVGLIKAQKERPEDDTGVHLVWAGKPVAKIKARKIVRWIKRIAIALAPIASGFAAHWLHRLGILK